jgi:hypothetical protein
MLHALHSAEREKYQLLFFIILIEYFRLTVFVILFSLLGLIFSAVLCCLFALLPSSLSRPITPVSTSFNIGDKDVSFQVQRLIAADVRIIIYWGLTGDLRTLWYAAEAAAASGQPNLLGDSYQWVLDHAVTVPQNVLDSTGNLDPNMVRWSRGQIGMRYYINRSTEAYSGFEQRFRARPVADETNSVNPKTFNIDTLLPFSYGQCEDTNEYALSIFRCSMKRKVVFTNFCFLLILLFFLFFFFM